ncbi:hypothetical protein ACF0H5_013676 [Mactra antiquata]
MLVRIPRIVLTFIVWLDIHNCQIIDHGYADNRDSSAPDFLPSPSNVTFHKGELAVLRCSVYNLGTKTVVWRRLQSTFPLTSGTMTLVADDRFQISHEQYKNQWDLMIKNVKPEDAGVYECQVASRDKTARKLVQLTVVVDPEVYTQELKITEELFVERGETILLQCNATGEYYPPESMDWFLNGQRVSSNSEMGIEIEKRYSLNKRTFCSSLRIERASMNDGGTYVCRTSDEQLASTKVNVLNAETSNRKRGTVTLDNKGEGYEEAYVLPTSGTDNTCFKCHLFSVITLQLLCIFVR